MNSCLCPLSIQKQAGSIDNYLERLIVNYILLHSDFLVAMSEMCSHFWQPWWNAVCLPGEVSGIAMEANATTKSLSYNLQLINEQGQNKPWVTHFGCKQTKSAGISCSWTWTLSENQEVEDICSGFLGFIDTLQVSQDTSVVQNSRLSR